LTAKWRDLDDTYLAATQGASDAAGGFGAASKVMRMALQSAVLGIGAYLVIAQEGTAGIMIACSVLSARALAPVDQAIANWRNFVWFGKGWGGWGELLAPLAPEPEPMNLPPPTSSLAVDGLYVAPAGDRRLVVQDVTLRLEQGAGLGIIGPSASGKSC